VTNETADSNDSRLVTSSVFLTIAFLAGAGTMLVEVLAPRIMQPYFGASTFVWTNVIGVILLAMALGYNLGGKLAEKGPGSTRIAWTLSFAALLTLFAKIAFPALAEFLLPSAEALADSADARSRLQTGSLVAAICLFCPPVFLLATLTPQIIQEVVRNGASVGRASGRVFMWGTLGSLVGTFLPTYWLVPQFGTLISFFIAAGLLFLPAAILFGTNHKAKVASCIFAVLSVVVLGSASSSGPIREVLEGEELLFEAESRYQYLRLVKKPAVEDPSIQETKLCLDEGLLDFHSVDTHGRVGTLGKYYDYFAILPTLFSPDRKLKILVLGSGMGTMSKMLCAFWPEQIGRIVDVEIDPAVIKLAASMAREHGETQDKRIESVAMDARAYAQVTNEKFDLILVDAYARQVDIPFHMTTVEFFEMLSQRLVSNGIVALNVSAKDPEAALTKSILRSMATGGLRGLHSTWIRYWGNRMLWGGSNRVSVALTKIDVPKELQSVQEHALRVQRAAPIDDGAVLLTDDHAPVEELTRRSLIKGETK
jgi:spermidine synthase